jgi:DNA-binding CsgD family transcriptional regulator
MEHEACLVLVNIPRNEWCYPITEKKQLIGRSPEAEIAIPQFHRTVSRRHGSIWQEKGTVLFCDRGSSGGTRINGVWLTANEPASLVVGDRLTLGGAELRLVPASRDRDRRNDEKSQKTKRADQTVILKTPEPLITRTSLNTLSHCELNIVLWMARGFVRDEELGRQLHRSPNTIRTQISSISKKLGLKSRMCILNQVLKDGANLRIHDQLDKVPTYSVTANGPAPHPKRVAEV